MTYEDFISEVMEKQRSCIQEERKRYRTADRLFLDYKMKMETLGLHPLSLNEIFDRLRELDRMESRVEETHGDTPVNRILYESHEPQSIQSKGSPDGIQQRQLCL